MFETFRSTFGNPRPGTGRTLSELGLSHAAALSRFTRDVGGGIFRSGLISIASVREYVPDMGGWQIYLPPNSRMFAASAFGTIFATSGDDAWIVSTQYGEIIEADMSLAEVIEGLVDIEARRDILQEDLFELWNGQPSELPQDSILSPTPAIPFGGTWSLAALGVVRLSVYLPFSVQMFSAVEGSGVHVMRRESNNDKV